ncbi:unnamed protein product [Microthlaspi erraticum]|uniref:F-box associated beta-propeller type 1 domain-containing protein n=1 Tax=Microthlaspi erraticum TaxID=1685480 RepID=A0A6D2J7Q9_9BRAS|nr:unnamed protein product [Microthlaspi erraticum]
MHGNPSLEVIGKLSLNDSHSNTAQINIGQVSYCDGLLLCTIQNNTRRIVVWNPCTGQTKWIHVGDHYEPWESSTYTLGSYQDNRSRNSSYKILRCIDIHYQEFEICDINSNSWRTLDGPDINLFQRQSVYLKGKTYWLASDRNERNILGFLVSFDYTREIFECLSLEPLQIHSFVGESGDDVVLSVVREEKLSLLLQNQYKLRKQIWVTNKIDETTEVTWIKILDYIGDYSIGKRYFFVDEEKRAVLMCCEDWGRYNGISKYIYIVGEEENKILAEVDFGAPASSWPRLYNYVPSFVQIHLPGRKRKRCD